MVVRKWIITNPCPRPYKRPKTMREREACILEDRAEYERVLMHPATMQWPTPPWDGDTYSEGIRYRVWVP